VFLYLDNTLEGLVALLVEPGLLEVAADAHVLAQEHLTVLLQPVQHLRTPHVVKMVTANASTIKSMQVYDGNYSKFGDDNVVNRVNLETKTW